MSPLEQFWYNITQKLEIAGIVFDYSIADIIFKFILPLVVVFIIAHFGNIFIARAIDKSKWDDTRKLKTKRVIVIVLRVLYTILLVRLLSPFLQDSINDFFKEAGKLVTSPIYKSGTTEISALTIIATIPVLYIANLIGRAAKSAFDKSKFIADDMLDSRKASIGRLIRFGIFLVFVLVWLSFIGFNLSSIEIFLAVIGGGISFGVRDLIGNFFSGIIITLNKTVREGDFLTVETGDGHVSGRVTTIRLLSLMLMGSSGTIIIIPSSRVLLGIVKHSGHEGEYYYLPVSLPLSPDTDFNRAETLLAQTCKTCLPDSPSPSIAIEAFEPGALMVSLTVSVKHGTEPMETKARLMRQINQDLRSSGIKLANASH